MEILKHKFTSIIKNRELEKIKNESLAFRKMYNLTIHNLQSKLKLQKTELYKLKTLLQKKPIVDMEQLAKTVSVLSQKMKTRELVETTKLQAAGFQDIKPKAFAGPKLVHIDLKGSPPKLTYLLKFMKQAKSYGADGFLIEYEDMFPWHGKLAALKRTAFAYTRNDIKAILKRAKTLNVQIIPLIQTFGHLEFVLKHKRYENLRAFPKDMRAINPCHNDTVPFIKELLDQLLELHPDCTHIHIGGDEVEGDLAKIKKCLPFKMNAVELYSHHMVAIAKYIKSRKSNNGKNLIPIIWDDMMREWPVNDLKEMSKHVIPMVWNYRPSLYPLTSDMWVRYVQAFDNFWLASCYKGATKVDTNYVPVKYHVENNIAWLKIYSMLKGIGKIINGIVLTGWSRFTHNLTLCELLPASIPSLATCLEVLKRGKFDKNLHLNISKVLGFHSPFQYDVDDKRKIQFDNEGGFIGADVYALVGYLEKQNALLEASKYSNSPTIRLRINVGIAMDTIRKQAADVLKQYFDESNIKEWIKTKVVSVIRKVRSLIKIAMPKDKIDSHKIVDNIEIYKHTVPNHEEDSTDEEIQKTFSNGHNYNTQSATDDHISTTNTVVKKAA